MALGSRWKKIKKEPMYDWEVKKFCIKQRPV
jgi:hypothetical protein